ncbi:response regulator transcription factor [Streptomyces sp. NPDC057555]|uniref:response regulator transcription factor n=1 Tax=Streptomyces sp. NPDC057555 TaxID=3346166 RepID=UPI003695E24A
MIRIVIADDEAFSQSRVRGALEREPDIEVSGDCRSASAAEYVYRLRPHLLLLGVHQPWTKTAESIAALRVAYAQCKIALLGERSDVRSVCEALALGVGGLLPRNLPPRELVGAVRVLAAGGTVLGSTVSPALGDHSLDGCPSAVGQAREATLTDREREVLTLLAEGQTNVEIGQALLMSPATVKGHVSSIYLKLGTNNRVQTAVMASRWA